MRAAKKSLSIRTADNADKYLEGGGNTRWLSIMERVKGGEEGLLDSLCFKGKQIIGADPHKKTPI